MRAQYLYTYLDFSPYVVILAPRNKEILRMRVIKRLCKGEGQLKSES